MIRVVQVPEGEAVIHLDADGLDILLRILMEAKYGTMRRRVLKRGTFDGEALSKLVKIEEDASGIIGAFAALALTGEGEHEVG